MENKFLKDIFLAIITALLTATFGLIAWKTQFNDSKNQAFYEHKLTAMENYIKDASSMIYYMRFIDRVHLEIVKKEIKLLPDSNTSTPFSYVTEFSKKNNLISDSKINDIVKKIQNIYPGGYKLYQNGGEFNNKYFGTFSAATNFFGDKTNSQMRKMDILLKGNYYQKRVLSEMQTKGYNLNSVSEGDIDNFLFDERKLQLDKVITCMKEEIQKEKK